MGEMEVWHDEKNVKNFMAFSKIFTSSKEVGEVVKLIELL